MRQRHAALLLCAGLLAAALGVCSAQLQSVTLSGTTALVVSLSQPADTTATNCTVAFNYTSSANAVKPTTGSAFANCTFTDPQTITLFYATGVSFAAGDRLNLAKNQTVLRNTTAFPWVPLDTPVTVQPVLSSVVLTNPTTLEVKLPLSSTFTAANTTVCNSALQLWPANGTAAKADFAFTACSLKDLTTLVLNLPAGSYSPGDGVQVASSQTVLQVGTVGYAPSKRPVVASTVLQTASLVSATGILVVLAAPSSLTVSDAAGCNAVFALRTGANLINNSLSACAIAPDGLSVQLTLANASYFGASVTVNTQASQNALRLGSATSGVLYTPAATNVPINPTIVSAVLTATDKVVVRLPASSTFQESECAATFTVRSAGGAVKSPIASCAITNGTIVTISITAGSYAAGDSIDVANSGTNLRVGTTPYAPRTAPVIIRPTMLAAYYASAGQLWISLPARSSGPSPFTPADCNAALEVTNGNTTKPNAVAGCSLSADGMTLSVDLASTDAFAPGDAINVRPGQWKLRAGNFITGPAYVPLTAPVAVNPVIGAALLRDARTLIVSLPERSNGIATQSDCEAALALYAAGDLANPKASPFSSCNISADGLSINVTLTTADTYAPGDVLNVRDGQRKLRINGTAPGSVSYYGVRASKVMPTLKTADTTAAYLSAADTLVLTLTYDSSFTMTSPNASDCNAAFELVSSAGAAKPSAFSACTRTNSKTVTLTIASTSAYAAGDMVNIRSANALLQAGTTSPAVALYAPGTTAVTASPQMVSAAISNSTIYVRLPTAATLGASFSCNSTIQLLPSGSSTPRTDPFASCTLSGQYLTLTLTGASVFTAGDGLNLATNQTTLLAGSVPFAPTNAAIPIVQAGIGSALMTSLNKVVVNLNYDAVLTGSSSTDCNALFAIYPSATPTTAKSSPSPILDCSMAEGDKRAVTLTLINNTIFTPGDTINTRGDQQVLFIDNNAGPVFASAAANTLITPVMVSAVASSGTTIEILLPRASSPSSVTCANVLAVMPAASTSARPTTSCSLDTVTSTVLTVTLGNFVAGGLAASYSLGDRVNILSGNKDQGGGALRGGADTTGAPYAPSAVGLTATPLAIRPSFTRAYLVAANTIEVTLAVYGILPPGSDCNSVFAIYPNASTIAKSSPIASCTQPSANYAGTVTLTLSTPYAVGDTLNIRSDNTALVADSQSNPLAFAPRATSIPIVPVIVSALATSSKTLIVTLPTASAIVGTPAVAPAVTAILNTTTDTECGAFLAVNGRTLASANACKTTVYGGATTLEVTYSAAGMSAGDTVDISGNAAAGITLRAGNGTWGTLYAPRPVTINPALQSAFAVGTDTIVVTLPMSASFYTAGSNPRSVTSLSATDCNDIFALSGGKTLKACQIETADSDRTNPAFVTLTLADGLTYAVGDSVDIVASHPSGTGDSAKAKMVASSSVPYKALGSTGVTIRPSIASAVLATYVSGTGSTVEISLPVGGTFFAGIGPTAGAALTVPQCKTVLDGVDNFDSAITACRLTQGSKVITVTLGSGWTPGNGDTVNIQATHPEAAGEGVGSLRTGTTATSTAFIAVPASTSSGLPVVSNILIQPFPIAAAATTTATISVTLPYASAFLLPSGSTASTLSGTDCANIVQVVASGTTSPKALSTATDACSITSTTLTVKLSGDGTNVYASGDTITIAGTNGQDATKPALVSNGNKIPYGRASAAVPIYPKLVSATMATDKTVVVTLPVASRLWTSANASAPSNTLSKSECEGVFIQTLATDNAACVVASSDSMSITIKLNDAYTPGDTITIDHNPLSTATLRAGTSTTAQGTYYLPGARVQIMPVPNKAYAVSSNQIVVVLPVTSQLYGSDSKATATLGATDCNDIFTILPADSSIPKALDAASACKQLDGTNPLTADPVITGSKLVMITLATGVSYTSGDTVRLVATHGAANKASLKAFTVDSQSLYAAGSPALPILPGIVSAVPTAQDTIAVTLPAASVFFGANSGSAAGLLSKDLCENIFTFTPPRTLHATNPCTLSPGSATTSTGATTVSIKLDTDAFAAGDAINIKADASATGALLRAGLTSTSATYASYAAPFVTNVKIVPTAVVKAVATSATSVTVTLPVQSAFYDTTPATATPLSKVNCDNAILVAQPSGSSKLADTNACALTAQSTTLTLTFDGSKAFADGDQVTVVNTADGHTLRVYDSTAAKSIPYGAGAAVKIRPTIASAVATSTSVVVATLLVPGSLYPAASPNNPATSLSANDCATIIEFTPPLASGTTFTCSISSDGTKLTVTFSGAAFSSGMKINIKGDHPATNGAALKGTVSGAAFAKRASAVDVEAVVASAVTTSPTTVNVGLSVPAYLAASGGSPTADNGQSMDAAACMEALSILSPDATTAPVIGTCTMLDATDTVGKSELVITYTTYPAGFTSFTVDTGSQSSSTTSETLRAAGGNNRLFVPYKAVDVLPYNKLVSATLVSANQVVVALPGVSKLWVDSNTARPPLVAASDCVSMLGIAAVSTTTPLLSDRLSSCSLAADFKSITLTLASSTSYVAGDVVNVATANTLLQYGTGFSIANKYVDGAVTIRPTIISAKAIGPKVIEVTLPVGGGLYTGSGGSTPALALADMSLADCSGVVEVLSGYKGAAGVAGKPLVSSASQCVMKGASSTGGKSLLVYTGVNLEANDYIDVKASHGANPDPSLRTYATATASRVPFISRPSGPIFIAPTIISAVATSKKTVEATLAFACSFWASSAAATPITTLEGALCAQVLGVQPKDGSANRAMASCALDSTGTIITITLADATFAAGDKVDILQTHGSVDTQPRLRAGASKDGALAVQLGAGAGPSASGVTIRPVIASAVATAPRTVVLTLPIASSLVAQDQEVAQSANALTSTGPTDCDDVLDFGSPDTTATACSIDTTGTKLTVTTAADVNDGTTVNVQAAMEPINKATSASLRATDEIINVWYSDYRTAIPVVPGIQAATLITPTRVRVTVPINSKLLSAYTSTTSPTTLTSTDSLSDTACANVFTLASKEGTTKALAATDACKPTASAFDIELAAASYASGDTVDIAANHPAPLSASLRSVTNNVAYTRALTAIRPALQSAVAVSSSLIIVTLPTASSLFDASAEGVKALSGAACADILQVGSKVLATENACVVSATNGVLTLNVTLTGETTNVYGSSDTINVKDTHPADSKASLRALGTTPALSTPYTSFAVDINPALGKAVATAVNTIRVALPAASAFVASAGGSDTSILSASDCAQVLAVTNGATTKTISACQTQDSGSTLVITLDSTTPFAAGDMVDILATNGAAGKATFKAGSRNYVARPQMVHPGYLASNQAQAVDARVLRVQLPVPAYLDSVLSKAECDAILTVKPAATGDMPEPAAKALAAQQACWLDSTDASVLYVQLDSSAAALAKGDKLQLLSTIASAAKPLLSSNKDGAAFQTVTTTIQHTVKDVVLTSPTTVRVVFPRAVATSSAASGSISKSVCDSAFYFYEALGAQASARVSPSPIQECAFAPGLTDTILITLNASFTPGYYINLGPYVLYVDDYSIAQDNNVQYVASTNHVLLTPALFGASAVLKTPSTMTLRLPATSSLPASPTAAQCNAALQLFSPAGASRSSPIATCALGPDASSVDLVLAASYVYGNGETINAGPANAVLRYASADGPAYAPADDNLPILTTLASATLESLTSMTVRLPTPSVLPANLSDCATVLVFGANKTLTSCALTPDGTAISATIPATTYAAGDKMDVVSGQGDLRVFDLGVGSSFVPRAITVQPAFFATDATLATPTSVTVKLPLPSALASPSACSSAFVLIGAGNSPRNGAVTACALADDKVTLTLTLAADGSYQAGDLLNVAPGQSALTLDDGATAYVPTTTAAPLIHPVIQAAILTGAGPIEVTLPTASVLAGTNSDACSATISVATAAGAAVSAPFASCTTAADGRSITLTPAPGYTPTLGDTLDVFASQTNLRAGSATGPAYVPAAARVVLTTPSPPPPSPSPPPPPAPTVSDLPARGLSSGYLDCSASVGSSVSNTASNVATDMGSFTIKTENNVDTVRFRDAVCRDSYTGATVLDSTVSSHVLYGMDGLVVSPATGLARAASPPSVSATTFAGMVTTVLKNLGLPVEKYTTPLHKYDYYQTTFVNASVSGAAVANLQGMISSNVKLFASWFDGLNATTLGKDLSASEAVPVAQLSMAAALLNSTTDLTRNTTVLALLRTAYTAVTGAAAPAAHRRRLLQAPFSSVEGSAAALSQAVAESNKIIADQQAIVLRALTTGQPLSEAELRAAIAAATQAITMQSTSLAAAAQALANGTLSVDQFKSEYTGDALLRKIAETQVPGASGSPGGSGQPQGGDDDKDNKALIIGLVVGLVGGAIVIGVIVAVIVMRRRKQQIVANKGPAGAGEV